MNISKDRYLFKNDQYKNTYNIDEAMTLPVESP